MKRKILQLLTCYIDMNGKIMQKNMKKEKVTLENLKEALKTKSVKTPVAENQDKR